MFENFLERNKRKKNAGETTIAEKLKDRKSNEDCPRKTSDEIGKGNKMATLRFQTGGIRPG